MNDHTPRPATPDDGSSPPTALSVLIRSTITDSAAFGDAEPCQMLLEVLEQRGDREWRAALLELAEYIHTGPGYGPTELADEAYQAARQRAETHPVELLMHRVRLAYADSPQDAAALVDAASLPYVQGVVRQLLFIAVSVSGLREGEIKPLYRALCSGIW